MNRSTILLVDDEDQLRKMISNFLIRCGYNVIVASGGEEALEKALEFDGKIDLLLSDIEMPRMSGLELAVQLVRDRPDVKVLLVSAMDSDKLVSDKGWGFLSKPFFPNVLKERIEHSIWAGGMYV
jgi:CheY-like chemotaxis protein